MGRVHLTPTHSKTTCSGVPGPRCQARGLQRLRSAVLFSAMGHTARPTPCSVPWFPLFLFPISSERPGRGRPPSLSQSFPVPRRPQPSLAEGCSGRALKGAPTFLGHLPRTLNEQVGLLGGQEERFPQACPPALILPLPLLNA